METKSLESVEDFDDIATINGYHVAKEAGLGEEEALAVIANYSQDNADTDAVVSGPGLGFSDGLAWLVSPDYSINVEDQERIKILSWFITPSWGLVSPSPLFKYHPIRRYDPSVSGPWKHHRLWTPWDKRLLVVSNLNRQATLELPAPIKTLALNNTAGLFQRRRPSARIDSPCKQFVLELVE